MRRNPGVSRPTEAGIMRMHRVSGSGNAEKNQN